MHHSEDNSVSSTAHEHYYKNYMSNQLSSGSLWCQFQSKTPKKIEWCILMTLRSCQSEPQTNLCNLFIFCVYILQEPFTTNSCGYHHVSVSSGLQKRSINSNKAGLFESSFVWDGDQFDPPSYFQKN